MACFIITPFYWPFETSVHLNCVPKLFSAARSSGENTSKYRKTGRHRTALRGGNVMAITLQA